MLDEIGKAVGKNALGVGYSLPVPRVQLSTIRTPGGAPDNPTTRVVLIVTRHWVPERGLESAIGAVWSSSQSVPRIYPGHVMATLGSKCEIDARWTAESLGLPLYVVDHLNEVWAHATPNHTSRVRLGIDPECNYYKVGRMCRGKAVVHTLRRTTPTAASMHLREVKERGFGDYVGLVKVVQRRRPRLGGAPGRRTREAETGIAACSTRLFRFKQKCSKAGGE